MVRREQDVTTPGPRPAGLLILDTLPERTEVGGRVQPRPVPGGAERRLDHGRHRALAVRASDVNRPEPVLRPAHGFQHAPGALEAPPDTAGEPGKEILYPVATVILGGLVTNTLLDFLVTPGLLWVFGRRATARSAAEREQRSEALEAALRD